MGIPGFWLFKEKWLWILIVILIFIILLSCLLIWLLLLLPPGLTILVVTICIVIAWGVVSGYKDWVLHKREAEEEF
jgi:hypothetical protein